MLQRPIYIEYRWDYGPEFLIHFDTELPTATVSDIKRDLGELADILLVHDYSENRPITILKVMVHDELNLEELADLQDQLHNTLHPFHDTPCDARFAWVENEREEIIAFVTIFAVRALIYREKVTQLVERAMCIPGIRTVDHDKKFGFLICVQAKPDKRSNFTRAAEVAESLGVFICEYSELPNARPQ